MGIGSLAAEPDDLVTAVFAEHGDMYFAGREPQLVLQPGIDALSVEAPVLLHCVQGLVGLYRLRRTVSLASRPIGRWLPPGCALT